MHTTRITLTCLLVALMAAPLSAQLKSYPRSPVGQYRNQPQARIAQTITPRRTYASWPGYVAPPISQPIVQVSQEQSQQPNTTYDRPRIVMPRLARLQDVSLIHDHPAELRQYDIVTIVVDEKSELSRNQRFNRQKNAQLLADLKEFVRIGATGNLANAAANNPKIDAALQSRLNATGQVTATEGIKYRIAATITDIRPNGTVVLEATKSIRTEDGRSTYQLTGILRAQDIGPDNTASSENIANLTIVKQQDGALHDSAKRPWGVRLLDLLSPF